MKIIRFENNGRVYWGIPTEGASRSARRISGNIFQSPYLTDEILAVDRLLAPLIPVDIICIGLNYLDHAAETKSDVPKRPMLFIKSSNTLNASGGEIPIPKLSEKIDYEAELVIVISRTAKNVPRERAMEYVFGYTIANDVSARDWQKDKDLNEGQFARGKSFDGFCPLGPCIVTADEIPDPNNLTIRTLLNERVMQDSSTRQMIFDVPALVASVTSTMTLRAGSIILTGTPSGVGAGRTPPVWMRAGDRVSVEIERIGRLENTVVAERETAVSEPAPPLPAAAPRQADRDAPSGAAAPTVIDYSPAANRPMGRWIPFMRWVGYLGLPVVLIVTRILTWLRAGELVGFFTVEAFALAGMGLAVVTLMQIDQSRQFPRRRKALMISAALTFVWACISVLLGLTFVLH